jgi:hypothetical protein
LSWLWKGFGRLHVIENVWVERRRINKKKGKERKGKGGDVHKDAAAEIVLGFLDDIVDDHLFDVEHGEHGRGKDEQDGLRELCARACAGRG